MSTSPDPSSPPHSSSPAPRWCAFIVILLTILIAWPFIITGNVSGRGAYDDLLYHWPTIQKFAQQLPVPDLSNYQSATTPGYHLELSILHRLGASRIFIQLYASMWTIILVGILAWRAGKTFGKPGIILPLPLLASMYGLFPAIWLLPDNAGWLCVLLLLILALEHPPTVRTLLASGIVLAFLVMIRQVHIWAAAIIWVAAWMGTHDQTPTPSKLFSEIAPRTRRLALGLIAALPAALILLYFFKLWGGLVTPAFQDQHQGPNPATPAFILTQIAILSAFFAPVMLPQLLSIVNARKGWILLALAAGLLIGIIPHSSHSVEDGRFSGYWNIIQKFPTFADRSPIIILGSTAGAVACVLWCSMIAKRDAWILMITLIAFTAAQSANHASWQRYHEPMLIITGIIILTRSHITIQFPKRVLLGSLALTMVLAAITLPTLFNAQSFETEPQTHTDQTQHPAPQSDKITRLSQQIP